MRGVRATLIQCISELVAYLQPHLQPLVEKYAAQGAVYEDALQFVIAEELDLVYMLFDHHHSRHRRCTPYVHIYYELRSSLPLELSVVFSHYVSAPRVYNDSEIQIRLLRTDLYIGYVRNPLQPLPDAYSHMQMKLPFPPVARDCGEPARSVGYSPQSYVEIKQ